MFPMGAGYWRRTNFCQTHGPPKVSGVVNVASCRCTSQDKRWQKQEVPVGFKDVWLPHPKLGEDHLVDEQIIVFWDHTKMNSEEPTKHCICGLGAIVDLLEGNCILSTQMYPGNFKQPLGSHSPPHRQMRTRPSDLRCFVDTPNIRHWECNI